MRAQAGDINTKGAYNGTSMDPERRERQDVADYLSHMREVEAEFDQWRTDENEDAMWAQRIEYEAAEDLAREAQDARNDRIWRT